MSITKEYYVDKLNTYGRLNPQYDENGERIEQYGEWLEQQDMNNFNRVCNYVTRLSWNDFDDFIKEQNRRRTNYVQELILSQYLNTDIRNIVEGEQSVSDLYYQQNYRDRLTKKHYTVLSKRDFYNTIVCHISKREHSEDYMKEWFSEKEEYDISLLVKMVKFYMPDDWCKESDFFIETAIVKKFAEGKNFIDGKELSDILESKEIGFSIIDLEDMYISYMIENPNELKKYHNIHFVKYKDYYIVDGLIDIGDIEEQQDWYVDCY